jgi:hypothetical protein
VTDIAAPERTRTCHLEWFINSRCDYACSRCEPPKDHPSTDLDVKACLDALQSFADFTAERDREAMITFYYPDAHCWVNPDGKAEYQNETGRTSHDDALKSSTEPSHRAV